MTGAYEDDTQPAKTPLPDPVAVHGLNDAPLFRFETGEATDTGCRRSVNEDSLLVSSDAGLWVVADGMGGHAAGDFASQGITEALGTIVPRKSPAALMALVRSRLTEAHDRIQRHARHLDSGQIGATVAALLVHGNQYACLWAGDSRVYLLRDGELVQCTRDHTEVQMLLDTGAISLDEAAIWPRRNVITRAIGVGDGPELDVVRGELADSDVFVLCSDGLTGHLSDSEIAEFVGTLAPQEACDAMLALTLERGARDNVTVIVARCSIAAQPDLEYQDDTLNGLSTGRDDV